MQRERFPNLLAAGNTIGHSGKKKEDHPHDEHLHFEIIYIEDEDNDNNKGPKSSFPTGKNFWYLNPILYSMEGLRGLLGIFYGLP